MESLNLDIDITAWWSQSGSWQRLAGVVGTSAIALVVANKLLTYAGDALAQRRLLARPERVVIISRYPEPGKCKTRLIPLLGGEGACQCQLHMTNSLLHLFQHAAPGEEQRCVELRYFGGTDQQLKHWLVPYAAGAKPLTSVWRPQDDGDLGQKMAGAIRTAFSEGAERVVVVGSDIPGLTQDIVSKAFTHLSDEDFVLGPALDGGYYLVGARRTIADKLDDLFTGMAWGTGTVREQQINVARSLSIEPVLLQDMLSDLDEPEDFRLIGSCFGCSADDFKMPRCAVIIPTLNEEGNIEECIRHTVAQATHPERLDIVVSDGGSRDATCLKVNMLVADMATLRGASISLVHSVPGRGEQQNHGISAVRSSRYLAFLHADTRLPEGFDERIAQCLSVPGNVLGAFHFRLDCLEPSGPPTSWFFRLQMRSLCWLVRRRVIKAEMPYGDQCLFTTREAFDMCGGFPAVRLMEDYILVKSMQRNGHVQAAEGAPSLTSCRRWQKHGYIRISGLNQMILLAYQLGVHPNTLADIYYGKRSKAAVSQSVSQ